MPTPKKSDIGCKRCKSVDESKRIKQNKIIFLHAFHYNPEEEYENLVDIGSAIVKCSHCLAMPWNKEAQGFCCLSGKVVLPALLQELLNNLLHNCDKRNASFLKNIKCYHNALSIYCKELKGR